MAHNLRHAEGGHRVGELHAPRSPRAVLHEDHLGIALAAVTPNTAGHPAAAPVARQVHDVARGGVWSSNGGGHDRRLFRRQEPVPPSLGRDDRRGGWSRSGGWIRSGRWIRSGGRSRSGGGGHGRRLLLRHQPAPPCLALGSLFIGLSDAGRSGVALGGEGQMIGGGEMRRMPRPDLPIGARRASGHREHHRGEQEQPPLQTFHQAALQPSSPVRCGPHRAFRARRGPRTAS